MKIAAIVNPFAGNRAARRRWPVLLRSIGEEGKRVDTFWSEYPGHSESIAASARRSGYDRVIAVGGDGTLFEVLNGLWWEGRGRMPSLGMVPFGTGCDYVRNFEIGAGMAARLKTAIAESAVGVSLGRCRCQVRGKMAQRVFAMVLGVGFDAEVIRRFANRGYPRLRWLSYALSALAAARTIRPFAINGAIDDCSFHADTVFFGAALGCCFGKGIRIAPDASPSRKRFEFVLAAPVSPLGLLGSMLQTYSRPRCEILAITRLSGTRARLGFPVPIGFEADGELLGKTADIEIELMPDAFFFAAERAKSPF